MPYRPAHMSRPSSTLATAVSFLAEFEPFASMRLANVVGTITGAIERNHCGFVVDEAGRIGGFGCYALTTAETAELIMTGRASFDSSHGREGEVVVMLMTAARDPQATVAMLREMHRRFPGQAWVQQRAGRPRPHFGRFPSRPRPALAEAGG